MYALNQNWLRDLVAPFEDEQIGLSYGGQTGDHRSNFAELQLLARWFPEVGTRDQDNSFCNNANCAIRRSLWESFGYDESLPGLEDMAFAREIRNAGHRIAYVPEAKIAHVHEEGIRQTFNRYRREALAYQTIFGSQTMSLGQSIGLAGESIMKDFRAAIGDERLGDVPSAVGFRLAQFAGAFVGYRNDPTESRQIVRRMYYPR